ncbi:MAG TPA: hypothetical protein VLZ83_02900 [Edaphocola sp.]|nr:hypothetical protein [Edaphocola sp.]
MNLTIVYVLICIQALGVILQLKVWKVRALLSPGFYFSIIWFLGGVGLLVFHSLGLMVEYKIGYIDELNILISFTGLCFILFVGLYRGKVKDNHIVNISFISYFRVFKGIAVFYLLLALFVFSTEGSGLDFTTARENMHKTLENRSFLVGYFRLLSLPLSIYAGSRLVMILKGKNKVRISIYFYLLLPLIADTLFSFTEGGRVAMVYTMVMYLVGGVLTLPINFNFKEYKKIILNALFFALIINSAISWVASVRTIGGKALAKREMIKEKLGPFSFTYGAIEYIQSSYVGYQFRRVDAVDETTLGYGMYTFNGFINWQIPFASRFGIEKSSIADAFDIYYFNQESYDFKRNYYYVTHSNYLTIIKDFGFRGAFVAIFFIVLLSHILFVRIQTKKNIKYAATFFMFYLFFNYWTKSNFFGSLSDSVMNTLYSMLIVDIYNFISKKRS